jgi:hypothetical protein
MDTPTPPVDLRPPSGEQLGLPTVEAEEPGRAESLVLRLVVRDREVIDALARVRDPKERGRFALAALRLGVLALGQARGEIDASRLRHEGELLLERVDALLHKRAHTLTTDLATALREYLDPTHGHLPARIDRLVADGGELDRLLERRVAGEESALSRTLDGLVGPDSPLLRRLDPDDAEGVATHLRALVASALDEQRTRVLAEFTLDDEGSALSRLVRQLTDQQGKLRGELARDLEGVRRQFSLDDEGSALSRLVRQVEAASRGMTEQFSLDHDTSALSRLRRELSTGIEELTRHQRSFQERVVEMLASLSSRRETEARGTQHGNTFEDRVADVVRSEAEGAHDLFDRVGTRTGVIRNNKKGDMVVTLGPDHAAAGRKIVIESKEDASYGDAKVLAEIDEARRNRGADVGVFVLSRRTSPGVAGFRRFGNDIIVAWDAEDPTTDVYVAAALSVARALILHSGRSQPLDDVDVAAMQRALANLEKKLEKLDQVARWTETIRNNAENILAATRETGRAAAQELEVLRAQTERLATAVPATAVEPPSE